MAKAAADSGAAAVPVENKTRLYVLNIDTRLKEVRCILGFRLDAK